MEGTGMKLTDGTFYLEDRVVLKSGGLFEGTYEIGVVKDLSETACFLVWGSGRDVEIGWVEKRLLHKLPPFIPEAEKKDVVNSPEHYNYNRKGIECIDAIEASMSEEEFKGYLKGNVLKYMWRYSYKGKPEEDLKKARWYHDRLMKIVEGK